MKREILFRGKRMDNGDWICGSLVYDAIGDPRIVTVDSSGLGLLFHNVELKTVGQFTGLTDIEGNKIFEDDILYSIRNYYHDEYDEQITEEYYNLVEWFDGVNVSGWSIKGFRYRGQLKKSTIHNMKTLVKGNLYDNPELIKKNDKNK